MDPINPTITVVAPTPGSLNNPLNQPIHFVLDDGYGSGIALSTLNVVVDGNFAINNGSFQSGYVGTITPLAGTKVDVVVSQVVPFQALQSVNVAVAVQSVAGNFASTDVFSFITLDNVPPQIVNIVPQPSATQVIATQPISFDIRIGPRETAIDINTLIVEMAGLVQDAYGNVVLDGYGNPVETIFIQPDEIGRISYDARQVAVTSDPDNLGYSIKIQPVVEFPLATLITVSIQVGKVNNGPVANLTYTLATIDDQPPFVINQVPAPDSIQNSIAAPITFTIGDKGTALFGTGVDLTSLQVLIDNVPAVVDGYFQSGYTGSLNSNLAVNGYNVLIAQAELFPPRRTVTVETTVADNSGNIARVNYAFSTEDTQAPTVVFVYPQPNVTNIPQNPTIITDIVSEVAISELDLGTVQVLVNNVVAFSNNSFQPGFTGSVLGSSPTTLSITVQPLMPLALGSLVTLHVAAVDVFGNGISATNTFTVTTNLALVSVANPPGGIYDTSGSNPNFPAVGQIVNVTLTANRVGAIIAYTTDGTEPVLDAYGAPQGTTQIFSSPIRLYTSETGMISHFAYDPILKDRETPKVEVYIFSACAALDKFVGTSLRDGLEWTDKVTIIGAQFTDNVIATAPGSIEGSTDYIHDLGRLSFIDSLDFTSFGAVSFKVRVADTLAALATADWLNGISHLSDGQNPNAIVLQDGYGPTIGYVGNLTRVQGRKATTGFFNDEATATLVSSLGDSFLIQGDMLLNVDLDAIVGASSFFRVFDDVYTLEVQQYVSKTNTTNLALNGLSCIVGETPIITIDGYSSDGYLPDGYNALTDGYHGFVALVPPPSSMSEVRTFTFTKTQQVGASLTLESDTTGIFTLFSQTPAVYNTFDYDTDVVYSSAKIGVVNYKRFDVPTGLAFAIAVTGLPLDTVLANVLSENLEPGTDIYQFAETNNVFTASIFLEAGDYNFRYQVATPSGTRLSGNPYIFETKQDLSMVQKNDVLVVNSTSYAIESITQLETGSFAIEFVGAFPLSTADILSWSISRAGSTVVTSTAKITVSNPVGATLGSDASGTLGNLVMQTRGTVVFTYVSSDAISIAVLGTWNSFNPETNPMQEGFDPTVIDRAFDLDLTTTYQNSTLNTHRVTVTPQIPIVVDRVRFYSGVPASDKQRTRLFLDSIPIARSEYQAVTQTNAQATYTNAVDIYASQEDGFDEWQYVQVGTTKNAKFRNSIALTTRLDALNGHPRIHKEIQIFTLPNVPQIVSDFTVIDGQSVINRSNKTAFAASSNNVTVTYSRLQALTHIPISLDYFYDDGIVNNFLQAQVTAPGPNTSSVYTDRPQIFKVGDNVAVYDSTGPTITRTSIAAISPLPTGLLTFTSPVAQRGIIVKDYIVTQDANNIILQLEVPDFKVVFSGTVYDFGTNVQITPDSPMFSAGPGQTVLVFQNILGVDGGSLVGGRLTYPLLASPARILQVTPLHAIIDAIVTPFLVVVIDQVLLITQDLLGAIIETFNTTKLVTDYLISKTDGSATLVNNSLVSSGLNVQIGYQYVPIPYQFPRQDYCFQVAPTDTVKITIVPTQANVTLAELQSFTVDFFNGVTAQAPSVVTFTINDDGYGHYLFSEAIPLSDAVILDGYQGGLFNPLYPNTGQQVQFIMPVSDIPLNQVIDGYQYVDGYGPTPFTSLSITFQGVSNYCIGEIEALAKSNLINSACRVTLNGSELFRSPQKVGRMARTEIEVDRGVALVYFNGQLVVRRPLVLQSAHFQYGATGKVLDDFIVADFSNVFVQQYFSSSPAKLEVVGRFIEINGILVS